MKRSSLRRRTPLRRTAWKRKPAVDVIPASTRRYVLERDGGCVLARFEPEHECWGWHELHHRKLRRFGDHTPDNLCTLCVAGHQFVHEHAPGWAYAVGLLLHSWDAVTTLEYP